MKNTVFTGVKNTIFTEVKESVCAMAFSFLLRCLYGYFLCSLAGSEQMIMNTSIYGSDDSPSKHEASEDDDEYLWVRENEEYQVADVRGWQGNDVIMVCGEVKIHRTRNF